MTRLTLNRIQLIRESSHLYDIPKSVSSPDDAAQSFTQVLHMDESAQEIFACLFLDTKNHIVGVQEISRGTINGTIVHPREVFKAALLHNASSIILGHNHPSGDPTPSKEDTLVTARLVESGKLMDIPILDHIIIATAEEFYSFKDHGQITD